MRSYKHRGRRIVPIANWINLGDGDESSKLISHYLIHGYSYPKSPK
jgi:hypothetical protein